MKEKWRVIIDLVLSPESDDLPPHQWDWADMIGLRRGESVDRVEADYGQKLPERMDN